jgi:hypothetical protein
MIIKQGIDIPFALGLDTKTDPKRVKIGNFSSLENAIFTKGGLLQKRNGFANITALPSNTYSYLTTLNDNLTAIGTNIAAFDSGNSSWVTKGSIQPISLQTLPLIRNNFNQTSVDSAIASNGLVCSAYLEFNGTSTVNKYVVSDSVTGQNIVAPTLLPAGAGTIGGGVRVYVLGSYFIVIFTNTISAVNHLQYISISTQNPTMVSAAADIAASYVAAGILSWDAYIANNKLYIAYNTTSGGQSVKIVILNNNLVLNTGTTLLGFKASAMSVTADITNPVNIIIYVSFFDVDIGISYTAVLDANLNVLLNPTEILPDGSGVVLNITSAAQNGTCTIFVEILENYSWDSSIPTHFIKSVSITPLFITTKSVFSSGVGSITVASANGLVTGMTLIDNTTSSNIADGTTITVSGTTLTLSNNTAGNSASAPGDTLGFATISAITIPIRSVGLASKSFIINGIIYFLSVYQSDYQSTYFLINGSESLSSSPIITAKLAYGNARGYLTTGLPNISIFGTTASIPYLYKDLIEAANKATAVGDTVQVAGIYSQIGMNLASFSFTSQNLESAEIANVLQLSGGFLWLYDGYLPVEHNFFLWPDTDQNNPTDTASWSATGGSIAAQPDGSTNTNAYFYQITYEWTDNQGNAYRSAPSIPIAVTTTGSGTAGSITLNIPTLRVTYKTANPVKIVIYRWSVGQQIYYQTTSITSPLLNDTTIDSVQYVDTHSDATILGNNIIYTEGGVVEDVNAPASNLLALFDTRLWLVDAEDMNLLWFSKQVIEATPVEMSDLFTIYIPPTTGSEGTTGPISAIFPMDDKLCIFKNNAILYINGSGPDNAGLNSQYSQPIFITSTVGSSNQRSIVLTPTGLMFQSNKGIWILGRDLSTNYIGAPVEDFTTGATVSSANLIPETNQVRFVLDSGITLMYDYFYGQWSTFTNIPAISSCIYNGLHTLINSAGLVYQENPGVFIDGSNPVLISFKTGPLRLGDLQNYQRAFFFYLLGDYYSPHKLEISIAYDYSNNPTQSTILEPSNYSTPYGSGPSQSPYGQGNPYGGPAKLEHYRVFLERQRCMAFSISLQEIFDGTYNVAPGQGFNLSGINLVMGFKNKFPTISSARSFG